MTLVLLFAFVQATQEFQLGMPISTTVLLMREGRSVGHPLPYVQLLEAPGLLFTLRTELRRLRGLRNLLHMVVRPEEWTTRERNGNRYNLISVHYSIFQSSLLSFPAQHCKATNF